MPSSHSTGWPSINIKHKPSQSPSPNKPSTFHRLTKPLLSSSPTSRLRKSKSNQLTPTTSALRGILTKHASLINLGLSNQRNDLHQPISSTIILPSTSTHSITKKVRFSTHLHQDHHPPQLSPASSCSKRPSPTTQADSTDDGPYGSRLEPVIETIFFTYSRSAYDRSPITVDRVFNKSLALPPRTQPDTLDQGSWLAEILPPLPALPVHRSYPSLLGSTPGYTHQPRILFPLSPTFEEEEEEHEQKHSPPDLFAPEDAPPHSLEWPPRPELFRQAWLSSEDALSESAVSSSSSSSSCSSSSQEPTAPAGFPAPLVALLSPIPANHDLRAPSSCSSLSIQNLAHHAFENLALNTLHLLHPPPQPLAPDLDPLCGFGNWTRAQVFDSCDALDGF